MRVLIGLVEVAGYYRGLKEGFDELGIECTFLNLAPHPFDYGGSDPSTLARWIRSLSRRRSRLAGRSAVRRLWYGGWQLLLQALLFVWALFRHDVFIFAFNSSACRRSGQ